MCILCVDELAGALAVLAAMFPFLKPRILEWRRRWRNAQMLRRSQYGRWA